MPLMEMARAIPCGQAAEIKELADEDRRGGVRLWDGIARKRYCFS
jgi:hypothetical protein